MPAATTEILSVADLPRWAEVLDRLGVYDFFHLPAYSKLAESLGDGRAVMFVYREGEYCTGLPLLLRPVGTDVAAEGEAWLDATSVYGYAGPLANCTAIPAEVCRRMMDWVIDTLHQEKVVSAFCRMHPLLPEQAQLVGGYGTVAAVGQTLSLDLTRPEGAQLGSYRRNHRQDIRRLRSMGITCQAAGAESLEEFVDMCYETMDRVGASPRYYFSRDYFQHLLADMPGVAQLFICLQDGRAVAAGIFTLCRGICQWYLSGSRSDFEGPPATKLMFDEARRWAIANHAYVLHLGGGVGGNADSLYRFKRGFAQCDHVYHVWKCIVNRSVYDELSAAARARYGDLPADGYFPPYRGFPHQGTPPGSLGRLEGAKKG